MVWPCFYVKRRRYVHAISAIYPSPTCPVREASERRTFDAANYPKRPTLVCDLDGDARGDKTDYVSKWNRG